MAISGLLERVFNRRERDASKQLNAYFKALTAYTPTFTSYSGGLYEMELTRAAVHAVANACSKLKPEIHGAAAKRLEYMLNYRPNEFQDGTQFLYRLATCLLVNNTAFVVPIFDPRDKKTIVGFYPALPERCTVKTGADGVPWLAYEFSNGQKSAIELEKAGVLRRMQYKNDFFGESNAALRGTMNLIHAQEQAIENGVKSAATIRFIAKLAGVLQPEDINAEREDFKRYNLNTDNAGGVMMYDEKYSDVKQIDSRPFVVDPEQMKIINKNVYNYFGVNEDVLQNHYNTSISYNAFYEGAVEPFAIQLGHVLTNMLFTEREVAFGNEITFSSNRMQYATNSEKLNFVTSMFDRGMLNADDAREVFNMPPLPDGMGKKYAIRGEYKNGDPHDYINGDDSNAEQHKIEQVEAKPKIEKDEDRGDINE